MIADLYVRVSTDEQAEKGYSQRDQEERLRKYCEIKQITVRKVIYEDHSAKTFNRPEWQKYLIDLKRYRNKVDAVLFIKWDRFSRNAGDAYQMINLLRTLNVEPQAIEQPLDLSVPENKMMLAFYLAAPEVENDRRALNTLHGMRRAKKEGRWMGPAPVGYVNKITEDGRKYIAPKEPEAGIMKWVFESMAKNEYRIMEIFRIAIAKGLKCSRSYFFDLLKNPVYCGKIYLSAYKDEVAKNVDGKHQPLISESLFFDVQDILTGRKRKQQTTVKGREVLQLRGYLICPVCGRQLTGSGSKGRSSLYYYYHCKSPCGFRTKADNANTEFSKELKKFIPRPGMKEVFFKVLNHTYKTGKLDQRQDIKDCNDKIERMHEDIGNARKKYLTDKIDEKDYKEFKQECESEITRLEAKAMGLASKIIKIDGVLRGAIENLSNLQQLFENGDVMQKRKIVGSIYPEKLVFDGERYRTVRVNEAARLIYAIDKGFSENKNGQAEENFNLSALVPRTGIEPALPCDNQILSLARLPVPPSGLFKSGCNITSSLVNHHNKL